MPVRIYDIAKKLGVESKKVLSEAKELGITAAKVASSSLDKITAEYLEQQLEAKLPKPAPAAPPAAPLAETRPPETSPPDASAPTVPPDAEPVSPAPGEPTAPPPAAAPSVVTPVMTTPSGVVFTTQAPAPAGPPPDAAEPVPTSPDAAGHPTPPSAGSAPPPVVFTSGGVPTPPEAAPPPPPPPKPQIGDKLGFIQLTPRPAPRPSSGPPRPAGTPPPRTGPGQQRPGQRPGGPGQGGRGYQQQFSRPSVPKQFIPPGGRAPAKAPSDKPALPDDAPIIQLKPPFSVRELAEQMKLKPFKLIADLMELGIFATVNQPIDERVAEKVCAKNGIRFDIERKERGAIDTHVIVRKTEVVDPDDKVEDLLPRPPVVTIMGHVDHGKTTLLDVIRKSDVAGGEAGGITQHIGAYTIAYPHPERKDEVMQLTFLDTPGHAAFASMRARGANVTDIVVLVVAANDGVMPQTLEALNHAKAARVPIIVAVNKCDHPNANPTRARQQLQEHGLVPDDWGGDTLYVECSALTKQGVDKLIESIVLQAELLELKANPNRKARGNVIESGIEPGGPVATVLVRKGTLRVGDVVLCGEHYGRVRALISEDGQRMKEAGPSQAVRILGLNGVPEAGLEFTVYQNEKLAREDAEQTAQDTKQAGLDSVGPKVSLENLFKTLAEKEAKVLKVIVKADTQGSVEAICEAIRKIESDKVSLEIIHSAVGTITENDVLLSASAKAVVLGFHTRVDSSAAEAAKREGVQIKLYAIIYELIDEVKDAMSGLLDPILKETITGSAEVRQIFSLSKGGHVAGCYITSGRIARGKARVVRRKNLVYEGVIQTLRRFQDEVNEVRSGMECGIRIEGFEQFQVGDQIECYAIERVEQKL